MSRRIDEVLSNAGIGTRREIRSLLGAGAVCVDGAVVRSGDTRIEETSAVTVRGVAVNTARYVYYAMHKPCGYVSSTEGADSLLTLVPADMKRKDLFPVGRLDKDTSGLILITNDGDFSHRVTSPAKNVLKTYRATLARPADEETVKTFAAGMTLKDGLTTKPARLSLDAAGTEAEVTISEGKYHEVRRMFAYCENRVLTLHRLSVGAVQLDLAEGEVRALTKNEIESFE